MPAVMNAEILRRYAAGQSVPQIAAALGTRRANIYPVLYRHGLAVEWRVRQPDRLKFLIRKGVIP